MIHLRISFIDRITTRKITHMWCKDSIPPNNQFESLFVWKFQKYNHLFFFPFSLVGRSDWMDFYFSSKFFAIHSLLCDSPLCDLINYHFGTLKTHHCNQQMALCWHLFRIVTHSSFNGDVTHSVQRKRRQKTKWQWMERSKWESRV